MLRFPSLCQKQGKWKRRKQNPDWMCTMRYDNGLYSAGWEEKIAVF